MADIDLCNQALSLLPNNPIQSLEEASLAARECSRWYPVVVAEMLSMHDWEFARTRIDLAEVVNSRPREWDHAYQLPNNCLTPLRLLPYSSGNNNPPGFENATPTYYVWNWLDIYREDYVIAESILYTSAAYVMLEYTRAEPAMQAGLFSRAVVLELAARLAPVIIKSPQREQTLLAQAELAKQRAMAEDANRQPDNYWTGSSESAAARNGFDGMPMVGWGR